MQISLQMDVDVVNPYLLPLVAYLTASLPFEGQEVGINANQPLEM